MDDEFINLRAGDELLLPARDVFRSSKRPDLSFKLEFARAYLRLGYVPEGVLNVYRENIFALNGGFEDSPRKVGVEAFERSFLALIDSLNSHGFLNGSGPVYVSKDLQTINGAHRVAAATALGLNIRVQVLDKSPSFDFDFFANRATVKHLDLAALIYVRECEDVRALIIHSAVPEAEASEILAAFAHIMDQIYVKPLRSNLNLYTNLKRINYLNPMEKVRASWAGSKSNGFWGLREHALKSMGQNDVRVVFFRPKSSKGALQAVKSQVRETLGRSSNSVHSTDTRLETFMVAASILHEESRLAMRNRSSGSWTPLDIASEVLFGDTNLDKIPDQSILLGGSAALDAHGIRRAKDIDLVVDNRELTDHYQRLDKSKVSVGLHLSLEEGYGATSQELLYDHDKHFYFQGLKVVSLKVTHQMKQLRNLGVKDKLDRLSIVDYHQAYEALSQNHSFRVALMHLAFRVGSGGLRNGISIGVSCYAWGIRALGAIRDFFSKDRG